jgi:hypothetical protein
MKRTGKISCVLAIVGVFSLGAAQCLAQQRVGADGHAQDASQYIGASGVNDTSGNHPQPGVLGNAIVYGDVTGGKGFRGFVPYSDPGAFTGTLAPRPSEALIQNGTGVTTGGTVINNAGNLRLFYGDSRGAPPPPGFVQMGSNGSYIQSPLIGTSMNDTRVGTSIDQGYSSSSLNNIMLLPGPLNPDTNSQSVITASPLTGVRTLSTASAADLSYLNSASGIATNTSPATIQQQQALSITQMRQQVAQEMAIANGLPMTDINGNPINRAPITVAPSLNAAAGTTSAASGTLAGGSMSTGAGSTSQGQAVNQPLNQPQNQQQNQALNQPLNMPGTTGAAGNPTAQANSGTRFALVSPVKQSSQYAMLRKRLEQQLGPKANPAFIDAYIYNQQLRERQGGAPNNGATPGTQQPGAQQPGVLQPGPVTPGGNNPSGNQAGLNNQQPGGLPAPQPGNGAAQNQLKTPPPMIDSLATGINSKTLKQVMSEAEGDMHDGRWVSAMDQYDIAEQLAPNNPLVGLGRAYAELGASYYAQADTHLRESLSSDPTLLMGRFDLMKMLGKDRVNYIVADLKGLASNDQHSPRPVFLLAYIYYNLGDDAVANGYLGLAEKRSGGDPIYKMLRDRWQLTQPAGQTK